MSIIDKFSEIFRNKNTTEITNDSEKQSEDIKRLNKKIKKLNLKVGSLKKVETLANDLVHILEKKEAEEYQKQQQNTTVAPQFEPAVDEVVEEEVVVPEKPKPLTAKEVFKALSEDVVGQDDAKKALSIAYVNHLKISDHNYARTADDVELEKSNILLIGPSGCGKTQLIKTLAKKTSLPVVIVDATELTPPGYIGKTVHTILDDIYLQSDSDLFRASYAIVFIDEVDKLATTTEGQNSKFERGPQEALLKIIEGGAYKLANGEMLDTKNMMFIFGGAFERLRTNIAVENKPASIGFSASLSTDPSKESREITHNDLIKIGLTKEFVGRVGEIAVLSNITKEMLKEIFVKPKNSLIKQYNELFKLSGIRKKVSEKDIEEIIENTLKMNCGARALKTAANQYFKHYFYK